MKPLLFAFLMISIVGTVAIGQNVPKDWEVSLERTGGLGSGPNYKITIKADGNVTFRNRDNETETNSLSTEDIRLLYERSESELILSKDSDYKSERDCDGPEETCWPSETISVTSNGRSRNFYHNIGCRLRPNTFLTKIVKLGEMIDGFTDTMFVKN